MYLATMRAERQIEDQSSGLAWTAPSLGLASILAVLSASCCVLPIGLSILGLGGTWLTVLEPFVTYRSVILGGIGGVLILAWASLLLRRKRCVRRKKATFVLAASCSVLFLVAASAPLWERDATRAMLSYWMENR